MIYENFRKELVNIVNQSSSIEECFEKLGWINNATSRRRFMRWVRKNSINIEHFLVTKKFNVYDKEMLEAIVSTSISYSECLRKLNLVPAGGNYKHLQRNIDKYGLDISHMKHNAHNQGKELKTFDNLVSNDSIKKRLILERGHKCESCHSEEWLDVPIPLELEHIDGNNRNNERANLKLLCPNCHSLTPTWRGRKLRK